MTTEETTEVMSTRFQERVLACMSKSHGFLQVAAEHLKPQYFEGVPRQNICKVMQDFWKEYQTHTTDPGFVTTMERLSDEGKIKRHELSSHLEMWQKLKTIEASDWRFVLDDLVSFVKHQRIRLLIKEATLKHLPKKDYVEIEREMARIAGINVGSNVKSYDYFSVAAINERQSSRANEIKEGKHGISTGIKALDDKLHAKGFYQKELYIFMAPPKRGKTMSLLYFSNQAATAGYNVAHFTCEVSREVCGKRLDAMNTKTLIKEVNTYNQDVADRLLKRTVKGHLYLFEYPTKSLTPQTIEAEIEKKLGEDGVRIDMVVVDYLDICKLQNPGGNSGWSDQGPLAEELRGIAGKYCVPVVTATQVNRQGSGKATNSGKDVAGDYSKIMIADEIYSLSATDDEMKAGKLRIISTESRNSEGGTVCIQTGFAYGEFYTEYIGEDF